MKKYLLIFLFCVSCDYFNNPLVPTEEIIDPYTCRDTLLIGVWELYPPYNVITEGKGWTLEFRRDSVLLTYYRKFEVVKRSSQVGVWHNTGDQKFRLLFNINGRGSERMWEGVYDNKNTMLYLNYDRYFHSDNAVYKFSNILKKR